MPPFQAVQLNSAPLIQGCFFVPSFCDNPVQASIYQKEYSISLHNQVALVHLEHHNLLEHEVIVLLDERSTRQVLYFFFDQDHALEIHMVALQEHKHHE